MVERDHVKSYVSLMFIIKRRIAVVMHLYNDPGLVRYKAAAVDMCYLQFRFILEDIAFSSLSLNRKLSKKLEKSKDYHADRILREIEREFGDVYPDPVVQAPSSLPGVKSNLDGRPDEYLTRLEFSRLYGKCGDLLHGKNPLREQRDYEGDWKEIPVWTEKIRKLLGTHLAKVVGDHNLYLVQMVQGVDNLPTMTVFTPED